MQLNLNPTKNFSHTVIMLSMVIALAISAFVSTDIYLPSFPSMVAHFQVTPSAIQLSLTLFSLAFAVSSYIFGVASDRFGRKPALLTGIALFILGSVINLDVNSIYFLYFGRILQGLGIGAASTISRILLRDQFKSEKLSILFSWVAVVVVLVPAVAPFVGGFLQQEFNFMGSLYFMLIYGLLIFAMVLFCLPETHKELIPNAIQPKYLMQEMKILFKQKRFIFSVLTNGAIFSLVLCYSLVTPFIFQDHYHYTPTQYGLTILFIAFGMVLGVGLNRVMRRFFSMERVILVGITISITMNFLLLILSFLQSITPDLIIALLFLSNIGIIFVLPNNAALVFSLFKKGMGLIGAVYGALRMFIAAMIGILIPAMHVVTTTNMAIVLTLISCMALGFSLLSGCSKTGFRENSQA